VRRDALAERYVGAGNVGQGKRYQDDDDIEDARSESVEGEPGAERLADRHGLGVTLACGCGDTRCR
jgi:hypothetical protein